MTQTLVLTDYEATLIEQALRQALNPYRPREPHADSDIFTIRNIADRLMRDSVAPPRNCHIERQSDEYACSCGARWDVTDGIEHP